MLKEKLLFLVHLPPPVHGASLMNDMYLKSEIINDSFCVRHVKLNYSRKVDDIGKLTLMKLLGVFIVIGRITHLLIFFRPRLVYFEIAPRGIGFLRDSVFVLLCKLFGKKIIFHPQARGVNEEIKNAAKLWFYKFIFKGSGVILFSELLYHDVEKVVRKRDTHILPACIKDELNAGEFEANMKERAENPRPVLLFLSNMIESKGPLDVLELCHLLDMDKIAFDCLFVGAWQSEEFKEKWYGLLRQYGLQDRCKYLGARYGDDKKAILKRTDFLIFPTRYELEIMGLVILEAFMHGIPVLAYDNTAIKEVVKEDWLGYVSFRKDYRDLHAFLKENMHRQFDNQRIRNYFLENFASDVVEKKLVDIFRKETELL